MQNTILIMQKTILVIGGTGHLGGKVIRELLKLDVKVRVLVRRGSDARELQSRGVSVFEGDLSDPKSLPPALKNVDAVITTAIGYTYRRKGDTLKSVDDLGNRNLVDAVKKLNIPRFIFTSILTADKAQSVPHFWQKKLIEDYMDEKGVSYVSLRPGAFLDQNPKMDFFAPGLKKGKLSVLGSKTTKWSYILTDDLAGYLAKAAVDSTVPFGKIDIGMTEPMNMEQLVKYASEYSGLSITLRSTPWPIIGTIFAVAGIFKPLMGDLKKMFDYFFTGQYVADTRTQQKVFGEVPSLKDSVFRYCKQIGL